MSDHGQDDTPEDTPQQQKLNTYIRELLKEKALIDAAKCPHAYKLIDEEIQKVQASGRVPFKDQKFVDVYRERPVKVSVKVLVPVKEHPRYNFVGKLLGPKGNNLKQLQEETMCHISICGRGSIRDRVKEEELRQSLEPKYAHLQDDLHMDISTLGAPAEAHARIAFALAEIRKYLIPEYGDGSRQDGFMEIMPKPLLDERPAPHRKPGGMMRGAGRRPPPPLMRSAPSSVSRMPPKPKVMSILDRARVAMDDYDEEYDANEMEYDEYRGGSAGNSRSYQPPRGGYGGGGGDDYDAEPYYRESGGSYGMSGQDYGYKKRKTYMD